MSTILIHFFFQFFIIFNEKIEARNENYFCHELILTLAIFECGCKLRRENRHLY